MDSDIILISLSQNQLRDIVKEAVNEVLYKKKEKELMNFRETMEFLGVSASCLNKWKSSGKIPFRRMSKRIFFHREEVMEALKKSNYSKLKNIQC
jgi:hypothetical protein